MAQPHLSPLPDSAFPREPTPGVRTAARIAWIVGALSVLGTVILAFRLDEPGGAVRFAINAALCIGLCAGAHFLGQGRRLGALLVLAALLAGGVDRLVQRVPPNLGFVLVLASVIAAFRQWKRLE